MLRRVCASWRRARPSAQRDKTKPVVLDRGPGLSKRGRGAGASQVAGAWWPPVGLFVCAPGGAPRRPAAPGYSGRCVGKRKRIVERRATFSPRPQEAVNAMCYGAERLTAASVSGAGRLTVLLVLRRSTKYVTNAPIPSASVAPSMPSDTRDQRRLPASSSCRSS